MNSSREESSTVLAIASGKSAKSSAISLRRFQNRSELIGQQPPGSFQSHVIANAGEDVGHFPLRARRMADAIGGQQRQLQPARHFDHRLIARFFFTIEMALQLGIDIPFAKDLNQPFGGPMCSRFSVSRGESLRQRPINLRPSNKPTLPHVPPIHPA